MATLTAKLIRLETLASGWEKQASPALSRLRIDPAQLMRLGGLQPDPWQEQFLRSSADRILLLCNRQAGKSTASAALAVSEALCRPRSLILLLSPSERQSSELAAKVFDFYGAVGQPVRARKRTELQLHLVNGSRIIALPENERTIRGYSGVRLLLVDEASRVSDDLYRSVRPMLAVSHGRLVALSTPYGRRGWFFEEWDSKRPWVRVKITAEQCPRITPEFLEEERQSLGERWWRQEYFCSFEETVDAVFSTADIEAACRAGVEHDLKALVL